jgi:hypothetical protein
MHCSIALANENIFKVVSISFSPESNTCTYCIGKRALRSKVGLPVHLFFVFRFHSFYLVKFGIPPLQQGRITAMGTVRKWAASILLQLSRSYSL